MVEMPGLEPGSNAQKPCQYYRAQSHDLSG